MVLLYFIRNNCLESLGRFVPYFSLLFSSLHLPGHLERALRRWKCLQSEGGAGLYLCNMRESLSSVLGSQQPWMAFCPFPAVPGGSSQGSIDWVLGESCRTSAGLTLLCTLPLPERMSTSHGFAYQHTVSCLVEDFEDLLSYQKNS